LEQVLVILTLNLSVAKLQHARSSVLAGLMILDPLGTLAGRMPNAMRRQHLLA